MGALLFHIHNNTQKVEEWHRSSAYCERKQRVKMGKVSEQNYYYQLLTRWTSPSPSLLPLPPSLLNQVDFWSFGMVVFECVTGKRPFLHGDPAVAIGW